MNIWNIFIRGLSDSLKHYRLIIYMWVGNLIFALSAVLPLYFFIQSNFEHSLSADSMLEKFSGYWLGDIVYMLRDHHPLVWWPVILAGLLYLLLQMYFTGALLGSLHSWLEEDSLSSFFSNGSSFFGKFFKLFLLTLPLYIVALIVSPVLIGKIFSGYVENAVNEWPASYVFLIKTFVIIIIFTWVNMLADYSKIVLVQDGNKGVFKAFLEAARFLARRFFRAWGLYWLLVVLFLLFSIVYMETENLIRANSLLLIGVIFFLQQIYILFRFWIKVQFYNAQMEFYLSNTTL